MEIKRAPFKEIFGWCMFDFANSSYTTVIISVVYCVVFSEIIVPAGDDPKNPYQLGNLLWAWALAISYLMVVITAPIIGAITDYSATKKRFLFFSYSFCILATAGLWFVNKPGEILLPFLLVIISNSMFASSENLVSSFLPFLGPKEDLGKISGYAWGIGYLGGIASLAIVTILVGDTKLENYNSLRWVGPITGLFFLVSGIPTFLFLKEYTTPKTKKIGLSHIKIGFYRVIKTMQSIKKFKDMGIYMVSLFFSMAALSVIISFAFIYGSQEIKLESVHVKTMFLLIQVFATIGAVMFGVIQDEIGAKHTYNLTLLVWIIGTMLIYWVKDLTSFLTNYGVSVTIQWMFVALTSITGICLGATQSASRAIVGMLSPESKVGEFFGLWGLSGKIAAAFGLFLIGFLQTTLSIRNSFLAVTIFFLLSLIFSVGVNIDRGIQEAQSYKE